MSNLDKKQETKRDVRQEMITDDYVGSLYIPDEYKREGYRLHIANGNKRGWIQKLIKMGYSIVEDATKIGTHPVNSIDSAVRVFLSDNEKEPSGILMETPEELYSLRKEHEKKKADEQLASIGHTGIPSQVGEISIGNKTFK